MTLTKTLHIKEHYLQLQDLRAIDYCEKRWQQEGRPTHKWEMFNFIEKMLVELQGNGIGYPKVLLLRKKQIQSGQFTLPSHESRNEPEQAQPAAGEFCNDCRGRGYVLKPDGSPDLCLPCLGRGLARKV